MTRAEAMALIAATLHGQKYSSEDDALYVAERLIVAAERRIAAADERKIEAAKQRARYVA